MPRIESAVVELIEKGVTTFYVGTHGGFDRMVQVVLKKVQADHPQINWWIVLAYMPAAGETCSPDPYPNTLFIEGMERVPKRFAISYRNEWMLKQADYVICFITRNCGGAAQFVSKADKQGKVIINLASQQ